MDQQIRIAAHALSVGDPLVALKKVALRDDAPALAVRGTAMAQLGELGRARKLLRRAARIFGTKDRVAYARCVVAEAEIALVSRDLGRSSQLLGEARVELAASGDRINAAHAGYLDARRLLLIGRLDEAGAVLEEVEIRFLPRASRVGYELVAAGIAIRRISTAPAKVALKRARRVADISGIPALMAEVSHAEQALEAPVARLVTKGEEQLVRLSEVEALFASNHMIVDVCRNTVRAGPDLIPFATRPVLMNLLRSLAEAWPEDVSRETLLRRAFRAKHADESHRVRLRVEIARLREMIEPLAAVKATTKGYVFKPRTADLAVLAPPVDGDHAGVLALLNDGEAWASSALALSLDQSPRTVQRALEALARDGKVESVGRGRARRWIAASTPGFPTSLLLPVTEFTD